MQSKDQAKGSAEVEDVTIVKLVTPAISHSPAPRGVHPSKWMSKKIGEPIVVMRHVNKSRKDSAVHALVDINLNDGSEFYPIKRGEFIMLRGPSGGGKTTMLNLIGTIDKATSGALELFGVSIDSKTKDSFAAQMRLEKIGFVFQTFNLLATMSAYENVELPMALLNKLSPAERKKRALKLLEDVGLQDRTNHLPSELSGGEQQRVTIARALANNPELLLLDEPTGDLDTQNTVDVMNLILDINQKNGTTCIMVTHNPDLEVYADRILYLHDGSIITQAINGVQMKLNYEDYIAFLNAHKDE